MRYLKYGWFLRYFHINGASVFFILIYLHIVKGLYYKSYYKKSLWLTGVVLWLFLIAISFMGYVLPWGQMSYWGLVVITHLVTVIPIAGEFILNCIWGGPHISTMTLVRIYCMHFILPFLFAALALVHIIILHIEGSSSPIGIENFDNITFLPYFYTKDLFSFFFFFLFIYIYLIFFFPNYLGEALNYIEVDYENTPMHIVPEWYFLFVYGMLRCIPRKTPGILISFGAILIFFILPFYPLSSIPARFDILHKFILSVFVCSAINISFLATFSMTPDIIFLSQIFTFFYFFFFILLLFNLVLEEFFKD